MAFRFIIAALATYRLTQLFWIDIGPGQVFFNLRTAIKELSDIHGGKWEEVDEAINCPWCLGVYFAAFCAILLLKPSRLGDIILTWLGLAGAQAFMMDIVKKRW